MKTASIHNLGCKVNSYESQKMARALQQAGYTIVDFEAPADVCVINTCSVTAIADKKSRQMIHRARRQNPNSIIIAAGCYVQQELLPEDLDCDIILGNDRKSKLIEAIAEYKKGSVVDKIDINAPEEDFEEMYFSSSAGDENKTRAFIKIQDGCSQFCTYCIIPYVRGRTRSRKASPVIDEINELCSAGCKEVVLTGIHLSSYDDDGLGLIDICEKINNETATKRLRLSSLEPRIVTEDFVRRLSYIPIICPHFHLSLQSGCDSVIKRMNRKYTTSDFRDGVMLLRKYFDDPAITTDVIAGFPGESDEEFLSSKSFLEEIGFFEMHVFPYSRRDHTPAAKMPDQIPKRIKHNRTKELISLAQRMSEEYKTRRMSKPSEILFEESRKEDGRTIWRGYSREYIRYELESEEDLKNQIVIL